MHIQNNSSSLLEAKTGTFMMREGHPDTMSPARMGRQVTMLLERQNNDNFTDSEFNELHPRATAEDIVRFMTSYREYLAAEIHSDELAQKAAAIERYDTVFRETIDAMDLSEDNSIGSGFYSYAHKIVVNGDSYVVRDITEEDVQQVDQHFIASLRVRDLDHVEHMTAISYRDGRTVSPLIPGDLLQSLPDTHLSSISKGQIIELYDMMKTANQRGVRFDGYGDNLLYDPELGFTELDIYVDDTSTAASVAEALSNMVGEQYDQWTYQRGRTSKRGEALVRFTEIIRELIAEDDENDEYLKKIDETIAKFNQDIKKYRVFEQSVAAHEAAELSS